MIEKNWPSAGDDRPFCGSTDCAKARPIAPPITPGQVEVLKRDNVANPELPGLADLGIAAPTTLEAVGPTYLYRFRKGGQFADQALTAA